MSQVLFDAGGHRVETGCGSRPDTVEFGREVRSGTASALYREGVLRFWWETFVGILRRPRLWGTALRQTGRLARPGWWRRPPFLPVPDRAYLRFRMETQYGADGDPEPTDVLEYLEWCRSMERGVLGPGA